MNCSIFEKNRITLNSQLPTTTVVYTLLCTLFFTVILFFVPYQVDDFWYINPYRDYKFGVSSDFNFQDGVEWLKWHYYYDNARLANMSTPFTLVLFPKWLFNILSGIVLWFMFYLALRIGAFRTKADSATDCMLISTCVLCLPWFNFLLTADFFLNYVWTAAAMLYFLWLIIMPEKFEKMPVWLRVIVSILMLIAGGMHEASSAPACLTAAYIIFAERNTHLKSRVWLLFCFAIGTAYVCFAPSVFIRFGADAQVGSDGIGAFFSIHKLISVYLIYIYLIEGIVCLSVRKFRKRFTDRRINTLLIALTIAILFSYITVIFSGAGGARVGFFGFIFTIPAMWLMFRTAGLHTYKWIAGLAVASCVVNLAATLYYQVLLKQEHDIVVEKMLSTDKDYIVYDLIKGYEIPVITLGKPCKAYISNSTYKAFNDFYRPDQDIAIVPNQVINTPFEKWRLVDDEKKIYQIGDYIVARNSPIEIPRGLIYLVYDDGSSLSTYVVPMKYKIGDNSYCLLMLWQPRDSYNKTVTSIDF